MTELRYMKKRMIQTEFAEHVDQTFKHWNKADNGELEFDVPSLPFEHLSRFQNDLIETNPVQLPM